MARVPYLEQKDLAAEDRELLARGANIYKALAHSPKGLRAFVALVSYIRFESRLDARLRELAILQVGYLARSPYEYSHHIEIGRRFGVSDADIRAIAEESAGRASTLEPLARAVLATAREMAGNMAIDDATYAGLRNGLDNEAIVDLIITISLYCGVVRLLGALQIDIEDAYKRYLEEFPLPTSPAPPTTLATGV